MKKLQTELRIDYDIVETEMIDDNHFVFSLIPNPERYDKRIIEGKKGYWDKLDELFIPLELLQKMSSDLGGKPIYCPDRKIDNIEKYTDKRVKYLCDNFENIIETYEFHDTSKEFLESMKDDENRRFVILSIDIKDSTKMSQELSTEKNKKIISLFLSEISQVIFGFNGYVLKYLGDGLLAYFPEPNYIGMNDVAIDCANSIKYFILNGLNSILIENDYPPISFRIGLDSGVASVIILGPKKSETSKDLIGQTINLATKIQSLAHRDKILAGEATIKGAHTLYRRQFKKMTLPNDWEYYKDENRDKYHVYVSKL